MKKKQLLDALMDMGKFIGDRIDGEDDSTESEFLHDLYYWVQDLIMRNDK